MILIYTSMHIQSIRYYYKNFANTYHNNHEKKSANQLILALFCVCVCAF